MCTQDEPILVPTVLEAKASIELDEEIQEELELDDPEPMLAKAILDGDIIWLDEKD